MLSKLFHDKRIVAGVFLGWGLIVFGMFWSTGILHSNFVSFGPSDKLKFMEFQINTWGKWGAVAVFGALDSAIWELAHEAIHPWALNSVLDPKTTTLPYSKFTCLMVIESYYLHGMVLGPFAFWISLTQFDLVLIKGVASMLMRTYSHYQYIKDKHQVEYLLMG